MEKLLIPARVGTPTFDVIPFDSTFPYLYLDLACKQVCFPPGKGINRRNESTTSELFRAFREKNSECSWEHFRTFSKLSRTVLNLLQNECINIIVWEYWRYLASRLFLIYPLFLNTVTVSLQLDSPIKKTINYYSLKHFSRRMATRNKKELAALNKKLWGTTQE